MTFALQVIVLVLCLVVAECARRPLATPPPGYFDNVPKAKAPESCHLWTDLLCANDLLKDHLDFNKSCDCIDGYCYSCFQKCATWPQSNFCRKDCKVFRQECRLPTTSKIETTTVAGDVSSVAESDSRSDDNRGNDSRVMDSNVTLKYGQSSDEQTTCSTCLPSISQPIVITVICFIAIISLGAALIFGFSRTEAGQRCFGGALCSILRCRTGDQDEGTGTPPGKLDEPSTPPDSHSKSAANGGKVEYSSTNSDVSLDMDGSVREVDRLLSSNTNSAANLLGMTTQS